MQWTGCHGEERHGGDRGCGGGHNGQGVAVRRDMNLTEVVEEDAKDSVVKQMIIQAANPNAHSKEDDNYVFIKFINNIHSKPHYTLCLR